MPKWIVAEDFVPAEGEVVGNDAAYPDTITEEESEYGFRVAVIPSRKPYMGEPSHIKVALVDLERQNMVAIKHPSPDGNLSYAIWDGDKLGPAEDPAWSVAELRRRFARD